MKILLDECLPRKLKYDATGHDVATVPEMGWAGVKNGELLRLAEPHFDVFMTADQNVQYQQSLRDRQIAIIVLVAKNNRRQTLQPLMPKVLVELQTIRSGDLVRILE